MEEVFKAYKIYELENEEYVMGEKISVIDERFPLKSKFKGGFTYRNKEEVIEIERVTDGIYCANGTRNRLLIGKTTCDKLKGAEVKVNINKITTNSITVTVEATDEESGIRGIYYSINDKDYKKGENVYTFNKLELNKTYTIYVKVINGNNIETIVKSEVTTLNIDMPTYSVDKSDWAQSKKVTITYSTIIGQTLTYEYSLDKGTSWKTATKTQEVTFASNGTIIARIKDGTNTVTSNTFTVDKIDTTVSTINSVDGNTSTCSISKTLIVNASDEGGSEMAGYSFDNGVSWQTSNSKTVTENRLYNIKVKDNAGNISSIYQVTTKMVDTDTKVTTPNAPELIEGLTPIKYNGSNWVVADTSKEWYNYNKQEWANATILDNPFKTNTYSGVTKNNGYASFDGVDDYMDLGLANYDFDSTITYAVRFKLNSLGKSQYILGNWEAGGGGINITSDNEISADIY